MANCGVYQIRNTRNGKIYIGSTVDFKSRKSNHYWHLRKNTHHNDNLQAEYNCEEDKTVFVFEILMICEEKMCLFYEQICIDALTPDYNKSSKATAPLLGKKGAAHPMFGRKHTEETKDKMKKSARRGKDNHMFGMSGSRHPKFGMRYKNPKQSGEKNASAKLTEIDVIEIIKSDKSCTELAKLYNITKPQVSKIRLRKAWKTITERMSL